MKQNTLLRTERHLVILFVGGAFIFLTVFEGFFLGTRLFFENQIQREFFENMVVRISEKHDDARGGGGRGQGKTMVRPPIGVTLILVDGSGNLIQNPESASDELREIPELLGPEFLTKLGTRETVTYSGLLLRKVADQKNPSNFRILIGKRGYPIEDLLRDILRFLAMNVVIVLPFWFMARYFVRKTLEPVSENMDAMSHFIHDAGHELKTPLAIISGNLQILRDSDTLDKDLVENSIATISSMSNSLGGLLELVSLKKGELRESINLLMHVKENLESHKKEIETKNITVNINIPKSAKIHMHAHHFQILLSNILQNAIRYNKENGTIDIQYKNGNLSISDTGIGMNESDTKKVFDRFFRVDRSGLYEGAGIGLSMVDRIVKLYEGTVQVKSTLGEGTTFIFRLP